MKQLRFFILILCICLSCSQPVEEPVEQAKENPEENIEKFRQEIKATWDQFADSWEAEDAKKLMTYYTVDGINIPPNSDINMGRAEIKEFYESLFAANLKSAYTHKVDQIQIFGEHAIEQGNFSVDWMRNDSSTWVFDARSMTHWVKSEDGEWKIQEFIFNRPPANN